MFMKHLSIPEGSDPRVIWGRVIIPSIRDKYQSMKCSMNNKIKGMYLGMIIIFQCAIHYLLTQCPNRDCCYDLYLYR